MRRLHCPRTGYLKPPISDANPQFLAQRRKLKRNTGPRRGREVLQVYASRPDSAVERPANWLAGFAAVDADPGETVEVGILIPERVFQHWSDAGWTLEPGAFTLSAGPSSTSLPLTGAWQKPPPRDEPGVPLR